MKPIVLLIMTAVLMAGGCEKKTETPVDMNYEYYPLKTGSYRIYQVDSIVWDDFYNPPRIDSFSYKIKDVITEKIKDEDRNQVFYVERYVKRHDTLPWVINKAFTMQRDETGAMMTIDNQAFVKMIFPVKAGVKWDGNAYNSMDEDFYEYTGIYEPATVNGNEYNETVTVEIESSNTLISNDLAYEIYAPNTGLIFTNVTTQELNYNTGQVESGYSYTYKLAEYAE